MSRNDPQHFLDGLNLANYLTDQFATITNQVHVTAARAAAAEKRAQSALFTARATQAALGAQRVALERQRQKIQHLLDSLTARQRREVAQARAVAAAQARAALLAQQQASTVTPAPGTLAPQGVSAAVRRVIAFAGAQVGKPYVFGAAGPTAYDCSGLTMQALYVGDDLAVSAADPALGIIFVHPSQDIADYAGATRLAG